LHDVAIQAQDSKQKGDRDAELIQSAQLHQVLLEMMAFHQGEKVNESHVEVKHVEIY
jgi:hypothetical protein